MTKSMMLNEKPRLYFIARKSIKPGDELTYDYGDRQKKSLDNNPWLRL